MNFTDLILCCLVLYAWSSLLKQTKFKMLISNLLIFTNHFVYAAVMCSTECMQRACKPRCIQRGLYFKVIFFTTVINQGSHIDSTEVGPSLLNHHSLPTSFSCEVKNFSQKC